MKNEIKILIAAIVVILILLVGAFALSGSNNPQPSATPTAVPATATPTVVPAGGNTGGATNPTPAPTVAPTATPTPTPTPEPASGVKQTEFGYWITYPPLDPQKWSTNPQPTAPLWNVTYFDPTTAVINYNTKSRSIQTDGDYRRSYIQRVGDLDGTVNVTFIMLASDNVEIGGGKSTDVPEVSEYNYYAYIHDEYGDMEYLGDNVYTMTFGPGMERQYVCVHVEPIYAKGEVTTMTMPYAWVQLYIVSADGGYGIYYPQRDFKVTVKDQQEVYFNDDWGDIWWTDTQIAYEGGFDDMDNSSPAKVYFTIPVYRSGNVDGSLSVDFSKYVDGMPAGAATLDPLTFAAGDHEAYLRVGIEKSYIMDLTDAYVDIDIEDGDDYYGGWYDYFEIYINDYKYDD
jgi:hypothetical protein